MTDRGETFLRTKHLLLRPLRASDADGPYLGWLNDPIVSRGNSHHFFPYTREQALTYIESARHTRSELILAIEDLETKRHIGNIALQGIHNLHRSAELSILLGDREFWRRGVGLEASRALVSHGFLTLGLNRIGCATFEDNAGMIKLATRLGMREEGRRRKAMWKAGRFVDVVEFGVLADEFRAQGIDPAE